MISIIIPFFNKSATIDATIKSISLSLKEESISCYEILIINDGSNLNEKKGLEYICSNYSYLNIKLIHKNNGGVSSARNTGLELSKYPYVYFLDADDLIERDFFSVYEKLDLDTRIHRVFNLKINRKIIKHDLIGKFQADDKFFSELLCKRCVHLSNFIFSKNDVSYFNEKVKIAEDILFIYEAIIKRNIELFDKCIAIYKYDGKFHASEENGMIYILEKMEDRNASSIIKKSLNERNFLSSRFYGYSLQYDVSLLSKKIRVIGYLKSPFLYAMIQKIRFFIKC